MNIFKIKFISLYSEILITIKYINLHFSQTLSYLKTMTRSYVSLYPHWKDSRFSIVGCIEIKYLAFVRKMLAAIINARISRT